MLDEETYVADEISPDYKGDILDSAIRSTIIPASEQIHEARSLFDLVTGEVVFGFNLRMTFAEASPKERDCIREVFERARVARGM